MRPSKIKSNIWRNILLGWKICTVYLTWGTGHWELEKISTYGGNNKSIKGRPLDTIINTLLTQKYEGMSINNIIRDGKWDLDNISYNLSNIIVEKITTMFIPNIHHLIDKLKWSSTSNGIFSTNSAYTHIIWIVYLCLPTTRALTGFRSSDALTN